MIASASLLPRILIVDDEDDIRFLLTTLLKAEGFQCLEAGNGNQALPIIRQGLVDLALLDLTLPGKSGLEILRDLRRTHRAFPVIMATAWGTRAVAEEAGALHVNGFLTKPFRNEEVVLSIRMALSGCESICQQIPESNEAGAIPIEELFGQSLSIQNIVNQAKLVAPTNFTVVISGETGVGKDVLAHAIHRQSTRCDGPFIAMDSGAIPESLMESTLFGHEKGSFTGADSQRVGCFESASKGTLFLDEIGNLSLPMQTRFLRALQERKICRVGSNKPIPFEARILVATNENLRNMVAAGKFRQDLFYRLNEFSITIPPLRDRKEDLLFLANRFVKWTASELGKDISGLSPAAAAMVLNYRWPGNVRELRNIIRRAMLEAENQVLPKDLEQAGLPDLSIFPPSESREVFAQGDESREPLTMFKTERDIGNECSMLKLILGAYENSQVATNSTNQFDLRAVMARFEGEIMAHVFKLTRGNMKAAARIMHVDYKTLRIKAKALNLSQSHYQEN
jgi:two-component system nitrogen regulation response regulator GlnG